VPRAAVRIAEARKLGFTRAILPQSSLDRLEPREREGFELVGVRSLDEALSAAFARS
jgi:predicted ATP-dependent serine protease